MKKMERERSKGIEIRITKKGKRRKWREKKAKEWKLE